MEVISNENNFQKDLVKAKKHSRNMRLWHWLNTIVITCSVLTVLVNSTILDREIALKLYQENKENIELSDAQIKSIVHTLEEKVWEFHIYIGYALAALLVFRIVLEFFELADKKFIRKLKGAYLHYKETKEKRMNSTKGFITKTIYAIFYLLLILIVITGFLLVFKSELHIAKNLSHDIKDFHGFCMYMILGFTVAHIVGIILAERKEDKGIVSDMINGGLRNKEN